MRKMDSRWSSEKLLFEDEMGTALNEWLKGYAPKDVKTGIKAVRDRMNDYLHYVTVDLASEVKVWQDFYSPTLFKFTYIYLEDSAPKLGSYYLDVEYWGVGEGTS